MWVEEIYSVGDMCGQNMHLKRLDVYGYEIHDETDFEDAVTETKIHIDEMIERLQQEREMLNEAKYAEYEAFRSYRDKQQMK